MGRVYASESYTGTSGKHENPPERIAKLEDKVKPEQISIISSELETHFSLEELHRLFSLTAPQATINYGVLPMSFYS